jgi:multisubunit Na+/H+ antiporter MnhB subunit
VLKTTSAKLNTVMTVIAAVLGVVGMLFLIVGGSAAGDPYADPQTWAYIVGGVLVAAGVGVAVLSVAVASVRAALREMVGAE